MDVQCCEEKLVAHQRHVTSIWKKICNGPNRKCQSDPSTFQNANTVYKLTEMFMHSSICTRNYKKQYCTIILVVLIPSENFYHIHFFENPVILKIYEEYILCGQIDTELLKTWTVITIPSCAKNF